VLVTAAACGSNTAPTPSQLPSVVVHLTHMPDGVATLSYPPPTHRLAVHLDMYGLAPGATALVKIQRGTCLAPTADTVVSFPAVTADAAGAVRVDLASNPGQAAVGIPSDAIIDVSAGGTLVACTDLPAAATAPLRLFAPPQRKPAGTATLSWDTAHREVHVKISAVGLPPGTSLTAELHSGSCHTQGAVLHRIATVVADSGGSANTEADLDNTGRPTAGQYLVVHSGTGMPVLCGDVQT
jgi:hypothetical protein